jgi:hypothetical protein
VACYDAADNGFFRAHRDNTTKGTAHRRFAVDHKPERRGLRGRRPVLSGATYRAPTGGAVVLARRPVTRGKRYLPFLYDEAAAQVRAIFSTRQDARRRNTQDQLLGTAAAAARPPA